MNELLPGVSVVIPCHNHGDSLGRAIQSALKAGANEVIVVNDASSDSSETVARSFLREPNVFLTGHSNPFPFGVCWARNVGIHLAHHELILPLDADDELLPPGIEILTRHYRPGTAVYGDYLLYIPDTGEDCPKQNAEPQMIFRKSVCHATVLFSKEDWLNVGGYKPEFNVGCEDWELLLTLVETGAMLIRVAEPIYRKAVREDGRGAKCFARRGLIASLLQEYHPKVQIANAGY